MEATLTRFMGCKESSSKTVAARTSRVDDDAQGTNRYESNGKPKQRVTYRHDVDLPKWSGDIPLFTEQGQEARRDSFAALLLELAIEYRIG